MNLTIDDIDLKIISKISDKKLTRYQIAKELKIGDDLIGYHIKKILKLGFIINIKNDTKTLYTINPKCVLVRNDIIMVMSGDNIMINTRPDSEARKFLMDFFKQKQWQEKISVKKIRGKS